MSENPLVSMITYCYNGERFVSKYFEAILAQDYDNIELIFFDNGSQDGTLSIAMEYKTKLENRGIATYVIHCDKNQSTCQLKQDAFHMMKGEYFFGCDSDDLIDSDYVSTMVNYLQSHPEKGIVYCQLRVVEEESRQQLSVMKMEPRSGDREALVDILNGANTNFTAISYMMSRSHFEHVNPKMNIYISIYGENYQIQIPFLYYNLQGYVERPLGQYTVRRDSYSALLDIDTEKQIHALKGQEESVLATLQQIGAEREYEDLFLRRIRRDRYYASIHSGNRVLAQKCYDEYRAVCAPNVKDRVAWTLYRAHLYKTVTSLREGLQRRIRRTA